MMKYLYNILLWIDEGGNVFVVPILRWMLRLPDNGAEGAAHYTISQFCAEQREQGTKFGCVSCYLLTKMFKPFFWNDKNYDHCTSAMKNVPWSEDAG